ncbi:MAG: hypothetical protein AABW50_00015 [Nanoarchaeota archaeon]
MRQIAALILALIFTMSLASAEIIITKQPLTVYNFGEIVAVPVTIKTLSDVTGSFSMDLICEGKTANFYKNGISLQSGQEKTQEASIILKKEVISDLTGDCLVKASLGQDYTITNNFKISNVVKISQEASALDIFPGESIALKGTAVKESGINANGFVRLEIFSQGNTPYLTDIQTVKNGDYFLNFTAPKDMAAMIYTFLTTIYEKDASGEIINTGSLEKRINVNQHPTNIEIITDKTIDPGSNLIIKAILHDQTGENIKSNMTLLIKNKKDKLIDKIETTEDSINYAIPKEYPPEEIKIYAESRDIKAQSSIKVNSKQDISMKLMNQTLLVENIGNLPYCNKNILVKIGAETRSLEVCLDIGKSKAYILNAPNGEYEIQILSEKDTLNEKAVLTGSAIGIKEATQTIALARYPFVWIFVIAIFGFITFTFYKKGFKKSFIGGVSKPTKSIAQTGAIRPLAYRVQTVEEPKPLNIGGRRNLVKTRNKAELSLSIQGEKQSATILCIKTKNQIEIESNKNNVDETLQKIIDVAESTKAATYENQGSLFFIWAPVKTRTFKNEETAIKTAERAIDVLKQHNKLFKQKIDFGVSLSYGEIVAKEEQGILKFMAMGGLMTNAKRIATISNGEILLSPELKEKLPLSIKTEKQTSAGTFFYALRGISDTSAQDKFIKRFLERQRN